MNVVGINKKMGVNSVFLYLSCANGEGAMENGEPNDKIIFFPLQPRSLGMTRSLGMI